MFDWKCNTAQKRRDPTICLRFEDFCSFLGLHARTKRFKHKFHDDWWFGSRVYSKYVWFAVDGCFPFPLGLCHTIVLCTLFVKHIFFWGTHFTFCVLTPLLCFWHIAIQWPFLWQLLYVFTRWPNCGTLLWFGMTFYWVKPTPTTIFNICSLLNRLFLKLLGFCDEGCACRLSVLYIRVKLDVHLSDPHLLGWTLVVSESFHTGVQCWALWQVSSRSLGPKAFFCNFTCLTPVIMASIQTQLC